MSCRKKEKISYHVARFEVTNDHIGKHKSSLVPGGSRYYHVNHQQQTPYEQDEQLNAIALSGKIAYSTSPGKGYVSHHPATTRSATNELSNDSTFESCPLDFRVETAREREMGGFYGFGEIVSTHPLLANNHNHVEVPFVQLTSDSASHPPASFTYNSYANQHNYAGENKPGTYHDSHPFYTHPNRVDEPRGMALSKYYLS
jgi:hypothetical protein